MKKLILALLLLAGCASVPPFPPPGAKQATAPQVNNPNCVVRCTVSAASEVAQDNAAPTTLSETQSTTEVTTQGKP